MTSEALRDVRGLCGRRWSAPSGAEPVRADRALVKQVTQRCSAAVMVANAAGAAIVLSLGMWAVPEPTIPETEHLRFLTLVAFSVMLPLGLIVGYVW